MTLKIGDKVRVYGNSKNGYELNNEICPVVCTEDSHYGFILVRFNNQTHYVSPKQCRKIKPKEKSVKVTAKQLDREWCLSKNFAEFLNRLGL
jgi:hypothetical protein